MIFFPIFLVNTNEQYKFRYIQPSSMSIYQNIAFIIVGFLWGATNPLIKRGSIGIDSIQASNKLTKIFLEIKFLIFRWQYSIPFLLNQCGSVLYVFALQESELSLAVPISNSCSFLFTALMAMILGEQVPSRNSFIGMALIAMGISICLVAKM